MDEIRFAAGRHLGTILLGKNRGARRRDIYIYIYRLNRVFASGSVCHKFGGKLKSLVTIDETGRMEWKMKK